MLRIINGLKLCNKLRDERIHLLTCSAVIDLSLTLSTVVKILKEEFRKSNLVFIRLTNIGRLKSLMILSFFSIFIKF